MWPQRLGGDFMRRDQKHSMKSIRSAASVTSEVGATVERIIYTSPRLSQTCLGSQLDSSLFRSVRDIESGWHQRSRASSTLFPSNTIHI